MNKSIENRIKRLEDSKRVHHGPRQVHIVGVGEDEDSKTAIDNYCRLNDIERDEKSQFICLVGGK